MTVDVKKIYDYWFHEAGYSWEVAKSLLESKKYPECLFFCHLTLEKILKAIIVVVTKQHAPPIHDLKNLLSKTKLMPTKIQIDEISKYTDFYLSGRYDEYKMNFRKKCDKRYTEENYQKINNYYLWLKEEAKKISPIK